MKTIYNKHDLLLADLRQEVADFGRQYVIENILPLIAPLWSDEALAEHCNMIVFRRGFFTSK